MRRRATATAAAIALIVPIVAQAAPTQSQAPSVSGQPRYHGKLTCDPGKWSAGATFTYSWRYSSNGEEISTGPTLKPEAYLIGYSVLCTVTATDATGQISANSPALTIERAFTTMKLKARKVQHKQVTLTGKVGPREAVRKSSSGRTATIVAYRVAPGTLYQLFGKTTLKPNGRFRIKAPDVPGKHTYKVDFNASEPSLFEFSEKRIKVTLKKR